MKKIRYIVYLALLVTIFCSRPVQASSLSFPPLVVDGKVSASVLKKGDCLNYSFTVRNVDIKSAALSFGQCMRVTWASEGGQTIDEDMPYHGYGTYNGKLLIQDGMQAGKWKIAQISFFLDKDDIGDYRPGYSGDKYSEDERLVSIDFSFSEFTVQGTTVDRKAPTVKKKSMGLTGRSIKKKKKVRFYVKVSDKSPVRYVICAWKNTKTKKTVYYNMKYNKRKQRYECTISDKGLEKRGDYRLALVQACDRYGNRTTVKGGLAGFKISRK